MTLLELARWLERSPLSMALRESNWGYAGLIMAHVLALGLFLGSVMLVDFRLIGNRMTGGEAPLEDFVDRLLPWTRGAFAVMTVSGLLLLCTEAAKCYASTAFRIKLAMIVAAGVNVWIFHRKTYRAMDRADGATLARARLAGAFSLLLWIGALAAGRAVGYNY
jgi:hypothetical protein